MLYIYAMFLILHKIGKMLFINITTFIKVYLTRLYRFLIANENTLYAPYSLSLLIFLAKYTITISISREKKLFKRA